MIIKNCPKEAIETVVQLSQANKKSYVICRYQKPNSAFFIYPHEQWLDKVKQGTSLQLELKVEF